MWMKVAFMASILLTEPSLKWVHDIFTWVHEPESQCDWMDSLRDWFWKIRNHWIIILLFLCFSILVNINNQCHMEGCMQVDEFKALWLFSTLNGSFQVSSIEWKTLDQKAFQRLHIKRFFSCFVVRKDILNF